MTRNCYSSRSALAVLVGGMLAFGVGLSSLATPEARAETPLNDPFAVIPMGLVAPQYRHGVAEVIRDHHFHRRSEAESFPCPSDLYMILVNEPVLTLALWQDLAKTPAWLRQIGPARFEGGDGSGATAVWEYVLRSPQMHVLLCNLKYTGPRQHIKLEGRVLLTVRTDYFSDPQTAPWVKHSVEVFVKIDSKGWKAVAKAARPIIEKLLEDQVQEAGWFVSLMARLIAQNPNWAIETVMKRRELTSDTRRQFNAAVTPMLKPEASKDRPTMTGLVGSQNQDSPSRQPPAPAPAAPRLSPLPDRVSGDPNGGPPARTTAPSPLRTPSQSSVGAR